MYIHLESDAPQRGFIQLGPFARSPYLVNALYKEQQAEHGKLVKRSKRKNGQKLQVIQKREELSSYPKKRLAEHSGITALMSRLRNGLPPARDSDDHRLLQLVHQEIRDIAGQTWLRSMGGGLQGSDLVNEAWVRILKAKPSDEPWENRAHFFNTVAQTMKRAILDELRKLNAGKREGSHRRVELDLNSLSDDRSTTQILVISEALDLLEANNPEAAMVVNMKYFLGYSFTEIGAICEISDQEVHKLWTYGRTWIKCNLDPDSYQ